MILAFSVARFTFASRTPGTLARAFSTRRTQEAQVIPVMPSVSVSVSRPARGVLTATAYRIIDNPGGVFRTCLLGTFGPACQFGTSYGENANQKEVEAK